jgi:hypothetical protein
MSLIATNAGAFGHNRYYYYYTDATFSGSYVGSDYEFCDGSSLTWGTTTNYRQLISTTCADVYEFTRCQVLVDGVWTNVSCP